MVFIASHLGKKGVIAQLVERLNGIEEVWGSNPHGSIAHYRLYLCPEIRFD